MTNDSKLWAESLESYKRFTRYNSESSRKIRDIIRERFPSQSKIFDAIDQEALK